MKHSEPSLFKPEEINAFRQRGLSAQTMADLIRRAQPLAEEAAKADANAPSLTQDEINCLRECGAQGLDESEEELDRLRTQSLVRMMAEERLLEGQSLTGSEVAAHLWISMAEVIERATSPHSFPLYSFVSGANERLFPRWQFTDSGTIPFLAALLATVMGEVHPVGVNYFMLTPNTDLEEDDDMLSPRDWLLKNDDPETVLAMAAHL